VWVLQRAELGRLYPVMALAFALVPIGSYFAFNERFQPQYLMGGVMIIAGIIVCASS
jgi:drug/metabolite transporter (DMT)-like permease